MTATFSSMIRGFGKVTIITGGSNGIGSGCAQVFVSAGAPVVIGDIDEESGKALAGELTRKGPGECQYRHCDVTRADDFRELVEWAVANYGRLDCLINNAGWHPPHRTIDDISIQEFRTLMELNLVSYFVGCKYALPHLRRSHGTIINISSLVGAIGQEWAADYVATKGGVNALTKALAVDEARHGVRVNAVLPGAIATPLTQTFLRSEKQRDFIESWQWTGRVGTMVEVGEACLFLASDSAGFITGVELAVSGAAELAYGMKLPKGGPIHL